MNKVTRTMVVGAAWAGFLITLQTPAEAQYKMKNLVTYGTGVHQDPLLSNAWGLAFRKDGPFFVADEATGVVTIYNATGGKAPLAITVPAGASQPAGTLGTPTGLVVNNTSEFVISRNGKSGPAWFIFDTLDGTISGWNPEVDLHRAVIMVDYSAKKPYPASYTGLELARNKQGKMLLYAPDSGGGLAISNNEVDMFDGHFNFVGHFGDKNAPLNMTVFNVQHVDHKLFVTYAGFDRFVGGYVSVFDTEGHFLDIVAQNSGSGPLENPFAVVRAPEHFGEFSSKLLIGNVDDGHVNAYDPDTYEFLGVLKQDGKPISVPGLWGLVFGGGTPNNGKTNQLFFAGGDNFDPNAHPEGSFGFIAAAHHHDDNDGNENGR